MKIPTIALTKPHHDAATTTEAVVANWHDEAHAGSYRMCQEQPCRAVRETVRDADGLVIIDEHMAEAV